MIGNSIKKKWKWYCQHYQKKPIIIWEKLELSKKAPNDLHKLHWEFSEAGKEERPAGHVDGFCQNLGITAYTLENDSDFNSNFSFSNESILEILDDFRTRGNASFNNLSQIIKKIKNFIKKKYIITFPKTNLDVSDLTGKLSKLLKILKVIPTSFYLYVHNLCQ